MTTTLAEMDADAVQRVTLTVDACEVAFVEFYSFGKVAIVTHTEVDLPHQGKGLGAVVATQALQRFQSESRDVVPVCAPSLYDASSAMLVAPAMSSPLRAIRAWAAE